MKGPETINLCLCWDDKKGDYSKFPITTIVSILENNKTNKLQFYLICTNISSEVIKIVNGLSEDYGQEIEFIDPLKEEKFREAIRFISKKNLQHQGIGAYYRLFIPYLLPNKVKRVIYFDCDIIVTKSLNHLWAKQFHGKTILGVKDIHGNIHCPHLDLSGNYINSGVLVLDLEKIRKIDLYKKSKEVIKTCKREPIFGDQIIINILFQREIGIIPQKYNDHLFIEESKTKSRDSTVLHFILHSHLRPLLNKKYLRSYYYYLDKTPYKHWRPKNYWKSYLGEPYKHASRGYQRLRKMVKQLRRK